MAGGDMEYTDDELEAMFFASNKDAATEDSGTEEAGYDDAVLRAEFESVQATRPTNLFKQTLNEVKSSIIDPAMNLGGDAIDVAGAIAKRANRGIVDILDAPASITNAALGALGVDEAYRAPTVRGDILEGTVIDQSLQPDTKTTGVGRYIEDPSSNLGFALEATAGVLPALKTVQTGSQAIDSTLDLLGIGNKPGVDVAGALDAARAGDAGATGSFAPQLPGQSGSYVAGTANQTPVPRIADDRQAVLVNNRFLPEGYLSMIRGASPETQGLMSEMVQMGKRVDDNPGIFDMPRDIVGNEIGRRADAASQLVSQYGRDIGNTARSMAGTSVDASDLLGDLTRQLDGLGVQVTDDGLDFSRSKIEGTGAEGNLSRIFDRLSGYAQGGVDFNQLHMDKQWLSEMANYQGKEVGTKGALDSVIKSLRSSSNDLLRNASPEYAAANDKFSGVVGPFREIAKLTGNEMLDFDNPKVIAELARKSRGLTNNTKQGVDLRYALDGIDSSIIDNVADLDPEVLSDLGFNPKTGNFNVDINALASFAPTLDNLFNLKPTSLQGITDKSAENAGEHIVGGLLDAATANAPGLFTRAKNAAAKTLTKADQDKIVDDQLRSNLKSRMRRRDETVEALIGLLGRQ